MPIIGPNRFASSDPTADDLHIIYRGSGGSLAHPKVVEGPQPKSITAKGNRVDVSWEQPLPAGTSVAITVQSDFTFTTPDSFVFTRGGQPLGPWTPYRDESDWRPGHGTIAALRARLAPTSTPRDLEVENRRGERAAFDRARLVGSLVLGNRTAEDSRAAVETLEPLLHAVGHTPISTTALRAAVGEVLLNPRAPDGTAIRDALAAGEFDRAASLLGHSYEIAGRVRHGDARGRELGFPTANIALHRLRSPLFGVYAVEIRGINGVVMNGVANVGRRPTVNGMDERLEVHVFDFMERIYGRYITVRFLARIRDEMRFDGLDALKVQIARDVAAVRAFFAARATPSSDASRHPLPGGEG